MQGGLFIRYIVVIDGEHYPEVTEAALREIAADHEVLAAVLVGGKEKLPKGGLDSLEGFDLRTGRDPRRALEDAIVDLGPDAVLDLSDDPVLDYRKRHELAAIALFRGIEYHGADFRFTPPPRPRVATRPSVAVIATGKRAGKTAVAGLVARHLKSRGVRPIIVAMGRGGPPEPEVMRGDEMELTPEDLLELVDSGKHGASDYIEDALLAQVPTVGCRRCGGGLAGGVDFSNVAAGVEISNDLPGDIVVLEGSGASIPPVHADATILVLPASLSEEYLVGYMGPYRLLLADLALITMCEEPFGSPSHVSTLSTRISDAYRSSADGQTNSEGINVVRTVFRPAPVRSVEDSDVFVATTAPEEAADSIRKHLETEQHCRVVGITHSLSDRDRLESEIAAIEGRADVLLCEIKAAGVDVATRRAIDAGLDVVYMDNEPVGIEDEVIEPEVDRIAELAAARFREREAEP